jgi:hypothetical protein
MDPYAKPAPESEEIDRAQHLHFMAQTTGERLRAAAKGAQGARAERLARIVAENDRRVKRRERGIDHAIEATIDDDYGRMCDAAERDYD